MVRTRLAIWQLAAAALFLPLAALAQYPSDLVGFNDSPIDDPGTAQEMFRQPQFSGTTSRFLLANVTGYDNNGAYRASGLQTEGAAAMEVFFKWTDPADPNAWLRLSTFDGPVRPNPALHTGGKVRFKLTNRSELFAGRVGICLGIRETGVEVGQLKNGGTVGPIEWVGVSGVLTDPNGLPLRPTPFAYLDPSPAPYELEFDLTTGQVKVNGVALGAGIAGFTGNGVFDVTPPRGTLEHIAFVNDPADTAVLIDVAIDELQFEAPAPDPTPAPTIIGPVFSNNTSVQVQCIPAATQAELFVNGGSVGSKPAVAGVATFSPLSLAVGDIITARQTANSLVSPLSSPVVVFAPGTALADDFDLYLDQSDLELIWSQGEPTNARKVLLASGGAASCDNFVREDATATTTVSRLYYNLGTVNGTDAQPLVVTYRFRHTAAGGNARCRFELTPALSPVFGAVGFAFSNGVGGDWATQYTTLTRAPSGSVINGYLTDYFGYDYALSGIPRTEGIWHEMQIKVKSTTVDFYVDGALANPIDPNDGTPLFPGGVPRVNGDAFSYVVIGVGYGTNGPVCDYDNVSATLGNTPIPFGPPNSVSAPTLPAQLLPGATSVIASGVSVGASVVEVVADGVTVGAVNNPAAGDVVVPVTTLVDGQEVAARQTVGGVTSCQSAPVIVAVPAPTVFSLLAPEQKTVQVTDVLEGIAQLVTVYRYISADQIEFLGSVANPAVEPVDVTVPPLAAGDFIVATQTVAGVESPLSQPVEVRDPGILGGWVETAQLPVGTTGHRVVYNNGYVYCLGGRTVASSSAVPNCYYAAVNSDGSLGPWTATTNLPRATASHGAAVVNGRIYVWGGWTAGFPTMNYCYYADPNPDGSIPAWTESLVTIPDSANGQDYGDSFGNGTLAVGNKLYIINGEDNSGDILNTVYVSTLTAAGDYGPWVATTPTPDTGSWFHGSAVVYGTTANYLYRVAANFGGTYEDDTIATPVSTNGTLGDWVEMESKLPDGRYEFASVVVDNKWIFAVTGMKVSTIQNTTFYTAVNPDDGTLSEWVTGLPYPISVGRNAGVSYKIGGRHYLLVVAGGPYSGEPRSKRCFYTMVGNYLDLRGVAAFQACYDPTVVPSGDCQQNADLNYDQMIDADDLPELVEYFVGPK